MSDARKNVRLKDGYGVPIFADGSIRLTIETIDGEFVMMIAVAVRGDTRDAQEAYIDEKRAEVLAYVDLINKGIDAEALAAKLAEIPARSTEQEG